MEVSRALCAGLYALTIAVRQACGVEVEGLVVVQEGVEVEVFQHVTTQIVAEGEVVVMLGKGFTLAKPLIIATVAQLPTIRGRGQATKRLLR